MAPPTVGNARPALAAALARARREGATRTGAEELLSEAVTVAAQLLVDVRADAPLVVPGERVALEATVHNGGGAGIVWLGTDVVLTASGGTVVATLRPEPAELAPGAVRSARDT
ncbi:MAG: hypothetical protein EHM57_03975, partial [Actinobacteria bacterium]